MRALPAPVLAVCPLQTLPDWWTPCFYRRACKCRAALERRDPPWCAGLLIWLDLVAADSMSSLRGLHIASALRLCTCCRGGLILYRAVLKGSQLQGSAVLDIGEPVRDYARVRPHELRAALTAHGQGSMQHGMRCFRAHACAAKLMA